MKVVAFVPIKLNSERLPKKNIRRFTNGNPLIYYILETILKVEKVDEIYVYCSSPEIEGYLPNGVKFLKRDPYFDLSTTPFNEVLHSFAELVDADVYVLTHATAPFIEKESFERAIDAIVENGYDSAFSVTKMQEFLWKDGKPFNYELDNIPRTQDLTPIYQESCGLYAYKKELILNENRRIGHNPYLVEISKVEATDINIEEDFLIADAIFQMRGKTDE